MSNGQTLGSSGKKRAKASRRAELIAAVLAVQEEGSEVVAACRDEVSQALQALLTSRSEVPTIRLSEFLALTGAEPDGDGNWGLYQVDAAGARVSGVGSAFLGHPNALQVPAAALNQTPGLDFPCTPQELLAFVDTPEACADFTVPDELRRAIEASALLSRQQETPDVQSAPDAQAKLEKAHSGRLSDRGMRHENRPKKKAKKPRYDRMRELLREILELQGVDADVFSVKRELGRLVGVPDSIVIAVTPEKVVWQRPGSSPESLSDDALSRRLRRLKELFT